MLGNELKYKTQNLSGLFKASASIRKMNIKVLIAADIMNVKH